MNDEVELFSNWSLVSAATVMTGKYLHDDSTDTMLVSSGGTASSTTIGEGGYLYVSSGGKIFDTVTSGAKAKIYIENGGFAGRTTLNASRMKISSGGCADVVKINSGGCLSVLYGGEATAVTWTPCIGTASIDVGVKATFTSKYSGIYWGADDKLEGHSSSADRLIVSGSAYVMSGGYATDMTILPGGYAEVWSKGLVSGIVVSSGGLFMGYSKSYVTGLQAEAGAYVYLGIGIHTVIEGSYAGSAFSSYDAGDHTVLYDYQISRGGLVVYSGGVARDASFADNPLSEEECDYSQLWVLSGGSVAYLTMAQNAEAFITSGGKISGNIILTDDSYFALEKGATLNFSVSKQIDPDTPLLNDWSLIQSRIDVDAFHETGLILNDGNAANYTVTISTSPEHKTAPGTYRLAGNADGFNASVAVWDSSEYLGTLSVGETKCFSGTDYSLFNDHGTLSFSIGGTPSAVSARSDVDGSGVSDVVFQYTGGDYQIGFWMNGTNTWQGQGVSQPSNWELLGAYDMDQNGKADIVMRGNIQIGADKGAYIGYYKDGDVTNWQNISFLNNSTDVDWKLAIGNLTGNEGCNSIVWYAPDLGALGVWTDGTANWVSLAGGFNRDWTMLGCGDFDGNGKDEVLFEYGGNLYTTDIDQTFASLGGWGTDWEVKAIGDFSGDGKDDLILQNGSMVIKFADGKAENWSSVGVMDASDWFIVGAGDYNGDEADDLLVRQYSTGMLGYYASGDMSQWVEMGRGVDMNWTVIA